MGSKTPSSISDLWQFVHKCTVSIKSSGFFSVGSFIVCVPEYV